MVGQSVSNERQGTRLRKKPIHKFLIFIPQSIPRHSDSIWLYQPQRTDKFATFLFFLSSEVVASSVIDHSALLSPSYTFLLPHVLGAMVCILY